MVVFDVKFTGFESFEDGGEVGETLVLCTVIIDDEYTGHVTDVEMTCCECAFIGGAIHFLEAYAGQFHLFRDHAALTAGRCGEFEDFHCLRSMME